MTTEQTQRQFRTRQERRIAELFDRDRQFRDAAPRDEVTAVLERQGMPLAEVVAAVMDGYAERPALARRARALVTDERTGRTALRPLDRFETVSYGALWARAGAVATGWVADDTPLHPGDFLGLLGFTSIDYATLVLSCVYSGVVAVPLQCGAPPAQLRPVVAETEMAVLATSTEYLPIAAEVAAVSPSLRRIVVFDHRPDHDADRDTLIRARDRLAQLPHPVTVETLAEASERSATHPPIPHHTGTEEALTMLIYTSGSTGTPKGAMYPQRLVAALWRGFQSSVNRIPVIGFNYLPMSHLAGHVSLIGTLARGGTGYFATASDLSTLFDDLALARPTELNLVPRICDMLHQLYQSEVGGAADVTDADGDRVRRRLREQVLGGRVVRAVCGTAPLAAETAAFMESCLDLELHDGYASTEAGGIMIDTHLLPPVTDYKLVDVPELGYFGTDLPHPRGELLLRTANIIPGYFERPELNASMFDAQGYFRTGDIVAELGPRQIAYLDRRSNVRKLANGEFVAVAQLESVFTGCRSIHQIFLHGDSAQPHLLAVIVPTASALRELPDETALRGRLAEELRTVAAQAGLRNYEVPGDFMVEPEPFSPANGLLSDSRKVLRPNLERRYADRFARLYAAASARRAERLRELRELPGTTLDIVLRAVRLQLDRVDGAVRADTGFADLGGDSLSAVAFAELLHEIFGVPVPVHIIVSPETDLCALAAYLDARRSARPSRPGFAGVHGADVTEIRAADITLDRVLGDDLHAIAADPGTRANEVRTVLLTGATGYLGRFVLLEQLARLPEDGRVICLVRAGDDAAARRRLDELYGGIEPAARYRALSTGRLEVIAADITAPRLGLAESRWQRLAAEVDAVVHAGALVNHVLPYRELFEPNVVGTAELIRLAVSRRSKRFTYISTVAAADPVSLADETADVRSSSPVRPLGGGYAAGYAASKWAGEVLLRDAHDTHGLPVTVLRPSMILAHSSFPGQHNSADMFTRLLVSLVVTGLAPGSFYRGGDGATAHYDGLPVDFVAEAVAGLGGLDTGYTTFHVVNPHDDGISLDTVVDWLAAAGYPMRRIDDYDDWLARFTVALHALPQRERQRSAFALLDAYRTPAPPVPGSPAATAGTVAAVRAAGVGRSGEIPALSRALLGRYLDDIGAPGSAPAN